MTATRRLLMTEPMRCGPTDSLQDAAELMTEYGCGAVPIVDKRLKPVGIVTERDIACGGTARSTFRDASVHDIMSAPAVTVARDTTAAECLDLMQQHRIRRLVVVDADGICCGMVSYEDLRRSAPSGPASTIMRPVMRGY